MRGVRTRQRAFEALIGYSHEQAASLGYPSSVTIPAPIHRRALAATTATERDTRERSILFSYRNHRWLGGLTLRGTKLQITDGGTLEASANRMHSLRFTISPPHLYLHTHPSPSRDLLEEYADLKRLPSDRRATFIDEHFRRFEALAPLPSSMDVESFLGLGGVSNLVCSTLGSFLCVRTDPRLIDRPPYPLYLPGTLTRARNAAVEVKKVFDTKVGSPRTTQEIRQSGAATVAAALAPTFVSYFSEDPSDPVLYKLEGSLP